MQSFCKKLQKLLLLLPAIEPSDTGKHPTGDPYSISKANKYVF
jgi:hypothetical protein